MDSRPSGLKEEDMIERVGDAIYSDLCGIGTATWEDAYRIARAAIEVMREPTEDMLVCLMHQEEVGFDEIKECWQKAIDAALKSPSGV